MVEMISSQWPASVPVEEPLRLHLPVWSRLAGSVLADDPTNSGEPFLAMIDWLHQHAVGSWRFVKRERVLDRVAIECRVFQFEHLDDARSFVTAWDEALIVLRIASLKRQIDEVWPPTSTHRSRAITGQRRPPAMEDRITRALVLALDVWPQRWRIQRLNRLRHRESQTRCSALVEYDPGDQRPS